MIPQSEKFSDIVAAFRDVDLQLRSLLIGNIDLKRRRIINAGTAANEFDYVTRYEVRTAIEAIEIPKLTNTFKSLTVASTTGFPKTISDHKGMFVYDSNGTAVHGMSLIALEA